MKTIFSCIRCGHCCHGETTVSLDSEDQANMLRILNITRDEALRKFWRRSGSEIQMQTTDGHCIFYNDGCSVHEGRPKKCLEWPLVKAILTDGINLETIRSSCPGLNSTATYDEVCQFIEAGGCQNIESNSDCQEGD